MTHAVEQILATLGIDQANVSIVTDRIVVIQRDPQPEETGIAIDTEIKMTVVDMSADPEGELEDPSLVFLVNGVQVAAYGGGSFVPIAPWSGSIVLPDYNDPYVKWEVTLVPPADEFESEEVVEVTVKTNLGVGYGYNGPWGYFSYGHTDGDGYYEITYWFKIQDLTPPKVLSAVAVDAFTVRVTFDEAMSLSGDGSALLVDNWSGTIQRQNVDPLPGVTLDVEAVEVLEGYGNSVFDLTVNWEMTQGCQYQLTVISTIEDANGNQIDPEYTVANFTGFQFAPVPLRRFDHWSMMVPLKNRQEDLTRDLERFSNCIAEVLGLLLSDVDKYTDQFDLDLASDEEIDAMLYDMGNPFTWPELVLTADEKRKLLRVLVEIYKLKGTAIGIESTIQFILGEDVTVVPYTLEGWVLGVDELGEGSIAEVFCQNGAPYDFSTAMDLNLKVDGYYDLSGATLEQEIHFEPTDFATPSIATAAEIVDVINSQINDGGAYVVGVGTSAIFEISGAPFVVGVGDTVQLSINGKVIEVIFEDGDFADTAGATAQEVADRFAKDIDSVKVTYSDTALSIATLHTGLDAEIIFIGGTALAALGIVSGDSSQGTDAQRVSIYSNTAGVDAWVQIVGGDAADVLGFDNDVISGTGGAILAPEESYQVYSFDIETEEELDDATKAIIRLIAEYMKVAHEHLVNIRTAPSLPWPEGWVIGVSELDVSTELRD